jgi:hypothetical protein
VDAIKRAYPDAPPEIKAYLETFEAESSANHEARTHAWGDLPEAMQAELKRILRQIEPQLFN